MIVNLTAKESPRFEDNKIVWYEGDTFQIECDIHLKDADTGEAIALSSSAEIRFCFFRFNKSLVHEFVTSVNEEGKVVLTFSSEISSKFTAGSYTYSVKYKEYDTTTIATNGKVEVESCQ